MKRDFLKNLGLEDSAIDQIMAEAGKEITGLRTQIANLEEDLKVKDGVIDSKNSKIQELGNIDIDAIKTSEYERGKADGSAEFEKYKFDTGLENILSSYKPKDSRAVKSLLDLEKVKLEDGKYVGLDEQLTELKTSHDYMFESEKPTPVFTNETTSIPAGGDSSEIDAIKKVMGLK